MVIERIGVVGADQMGGGIAVVGAQAGLRVLLHDASEAALDGALEAIHWCGASRHARS